MNAVGASLIAWSGVYAYVALFSGALAIARRDQAEYRSFAGYCASLALFALGGALTWTATSPAEAVGSQALSMLAVFPSVAFFVAFVMHLCEEAQPRFLKLTATLAVVGMMTVGTRLFFDPAVADASYEWASAPAHGRALARLTWVGVGLTGAMTTCGVYALSRLFAAARTRPTLRVAAGLTTLTVLAAVFDLVTRAAFSDLAITISTHAALLSILGFGYVLIDRFTAVDAQLERRTEELAESYDHLRMAQAEIVKTEQLAAVGELSAVIAHEVRNPLATIKNAVAGLRRSELRPEDGETLLEILDEETDRLNRLVDDLLAYAKPISPETSAVDLPQLVGHAVELAAAGNRDISHVEIELDLDAPCDPVEGDKALHRHALINIVDNALQAMPNGGTLTVSCRNALADHKPHVAVEFHDTGEGMDTLVRARARDPFFTTRHGGTGLGLAIVDRVARAHGGRVEIVSRHGQGTTVSFVIPCERVAE
ncbi:MAG: ATP-binding protein [Sandaracinaceae bacterium]